MFNTEGTFSNSATERYTKFFESNNKSKQKGLQLVEIYSILCELQKNPLNHVDLRAPLMSLKTSTYLLKKFCREFVNKVPPLQQVPENEFISNKKKGPKIDKHMSIISLSQMLRNIQWYLLNSENKAIFAQNVMEYIQKSSDLEANGEAEMVDEVSEEDLLCGRILASLRGVFNACSVLKPWKGDIENRVISQRIFTNYYRISSQVMIW